MKDVAQVIFSSGSRVLLGFRQGTEALDQCWGFPSGRIEEDELPFNAAMREAIEEVSVEPVDLVPLAKIHDPDQRILHYFYICKDWSGKIGNAEPHLCREVRWFDVEDLPKNCTPLTYLILPKLKVAI